jgi:conserved oligomeric Golgi complex subunit 8
MARPRSFSRRSLDSQRPQFSEHTYDSLLDLLSSTEPSLTNVSGTSPLIQGYLLRLTSSSLSSIIQEHATLDEEKQDLDRQLNRLAKREYHSFVDTASHGDAIATAFDGFSRKLDRVWETIPSVGTAVAEFNAFAKLQVSERERSKNLLSNHDRLLDILEMPSLVSTCVRNGYFSEAIQLSSYVKRLATLHYTHVPLIRELAEQVESAMTEMTGRLISLLKEPIKLPTALKVIPIILNLQVLLT